MARPYPGWSVYVVLPYSAMKRTTVLGHPASDLAKKGGWERMRGSYGWAPQGFKREAVKKIAYLLNGLLSQLGWNHQIIGVGYRRTCRLRDFIWLSIRGLLQTVSTKELNEGGDLRERGSRRPSICLDISAFYSIYGLSETPNTITTIALTPKSFLRVWRPRRGLNEDQCSGRQ
jgi:hypothetical protein